MTFIINRFTKSITQVSAAAGNRKSKINFGVFAYELKLGQTFTLKDTSSKLWFVVGWTLDSVIIQRVGYKIRAYIRKESKVCLKRWYNKKSPQTYKKLKESINFLYETKKHDEILLFVTITTKQHENKFTDSECNYKFGLWAKNRKNFDYVAILERQRLTTDIHYHCIIRTKAYLHIETEIRKLSKLFKVDFHPALFDVKRVSSIPTLQAYLRKYFAKRGVKECSCRLSCKCKPPYSSLFQSRTLLISKGINKALKAYFPRYVVQIPQSALESYKHLFVEKFKHDFCTIFEYKVEIWNAAINWRLNNLKAVNIARNAD